MSETNYFRLIEAYFEGNISPAEKAMLDAKIKSDPLVKAEFDLQQNIVKGISNARKLELKSRLASIDLPANTGLFAGSGVKWLAGTIAGVTIFGSVLYWSLTSFDNKIKPIDLKAYQEIAFNNYSTADFPDLAEDRSMASKAEVFSTKVQKTTTVQEDKNKQLAKEETNTTAKVQPQALMSYEDDQLFTNHSEGEELANIESREVALNRADKTEIEFHKALDDTDNFHYQYYNSKLYLYGNFKKTPYQIIELNDKGKKQLFLSHNNEVYVIKDNTTEVTELRKIQDEMLKMEIQLIVQE
ncbi:hypothetical protein MATR_15970 [Marivirga tractuosa]|uniref:Uncharacterized protein n=1 Tax=Marivirga tractuosa (strain ATCC 23168 / DSM 4126 / NBRC 15989 / NCIMB 1408 / VKM B-1430 / H-43) TaxID=643867 RepID=E4TS26_MARTH|nr:hypothetical protein [Marivirga tractuosa]ADR20777.1 hypothetical protein Ftrac_0775 [Marivirga tractuosa DSM 4126]BDD14772.1 hypothetical protein MATR_15970 [Marivirga tractuosa]